MRQRGVARQPGGRGARRRADGPQPDPRRVPRAAREREGRARGRAGLTPRASSFDDADRRRRADGAGADRARRWPCPVARAGRIGEPTHVTTSVAVPAPVAVLGHRLAVTRPAVPLSSPPSPMAPAGILLVSTVLGLAIAQGIVSRGVVVASAADVAFLQALAPIALIFALVGIGHVGRRPRHAVRLPERRGARASASGCSTSSPGVVMLALGAGAGQARSMPAASRWRSWSAGSSSPSRPAPPTGTRTGRSTRPDPDRPRSRPDLRARPSRVRGRPPRARTAHTTPEPGRPDADARRDASAQLELDDPVAHPATHLGDELGVVRDAPQLHRQRGTAGRRDVDDDAGRPGSLAQDAP